MAITLNTTPLSESFETTPTGATGTRRYELTGTDSAQVAAAHTALIGGIPTTTIWGTGGNYGNYAPNMYPVRYRVERKSDRLWIGYVDYSTNSEDDVHITYSPWGQTRYTNQGDGATMPNGMIADMRWNTLAITYSRNEYSLWWGKNAGGDPYTAGAASNPPPVSQLRVVLGHQNKVNNAQFMGFAAKSLLFLSAEAVERSDGLWRVTYHFVYDDNLHEWLGSNGTWYEVRGTSNFNFLKLTWNNVLPLGAGADYIT